MFEIVTLHFVWLWYLYSMAILALVTLSPTRRRTEDESREPRAQNSASAPVCHRAEDAAGDASK